MESELMTRYGIDYDKGIKNCMGNGIFYRKILSMFMEDDSFLRAKAACKVRDYKTLFNCAHELKGVSGNAALTKLYYATVPLVELLRGESGAEVGAEVESLLAAIEEAYSSACAGISLILEEK